MKTCCYTSEISCKKHHITWLKEAIKNKCNYNTKHFASPLNMVV